MGRGKAQATQPFQKNQRISKMRCSMSFCEAKKRVEVSYKKHNLLECNKVKDYLLIK